MATKDRVSPSGSISSIKTTIAIASTDVAVTASATATASLPDARVGDVVTVSPQANLNGGIGIKWSRVYDDDLVVIGFSNVGASTNTGASTFDAVVQQR